MVQAQEMAGVMAVQYHDPIFRSLTNPVRLCGWQATLAETNLQPANIPNFTFHNCFGGSYQLFGMAHPTPELAAASWDRVLEAMPDLVANNQPHAKAFATEPLKGELEVWKTCN